MDPIFELSAAPHMPCMLRTARTPAMQSETFVTALVAATDGRGDVQITECTGEIIIAFTDPD